MSPAALANFIDYETPQFDFSVGNSLYNFQPVQQSFALPVATYTPPVVNFQPVQPAVQPVASVAKKTISFTVLNADGETLPAPNIAIDGTRFEIGDANGNVTIPNVSATSTIKITFQGYKPYQSLISQLPNKVVLEIEVTALPQVNVAAWKKPKTSSNWAWWLVAAVGAFGIYKYSKKGTKIVHAKL